LTPLGGSCRCAPSYEAEAGETRPVERGEEHPVRPGAMLRLSAHGPESELESGSLGCQTCNGEMYNIQL